ncbi:hypothetical protein BDP67DRAFT_500327 [Colletotrichum lupini]|nr:hypothetical protein BDP67DRAFT_500327 [Colletotrichum lupini]
MSDDGNDSDTSELPPNSTKSMPEGSWKCCECSENNNSELCGTDENDNMKCNATPCNHTKCDDCSDPD